MAIASCALAFIAYVAVRQMSAAADGPRIADAKKPDGQSWPVLGVAPVAGVTERGFHGTENDQGEPLRWTDGNAVLVVGTKGRPVPTSLRVSLVGASPSGQLTISVNGIDIFRGRIAPPWEQTLRLPESRDARELTIAIKSDAWVPAEVDTKSEDRRHLGVRVKSIQLL